MCAVREKVFIWKGATGSELVIDDLTKYTRTAPLFLDSFVVDDKRTKD